MEFQIGDKVRVSEWFVNAYPDVYEVESVREDGTCSIAGGIDFAPEHLIKVIE